jgi:hypothetical protein
MTRCDNLRALKDPQEMTDFVPVDRTNLLVCASGTTPMLLYNQLPLAIMKHNSRSTSMIMAWVNTASGVSGDLVQY